MTSRSGWSPSRRELLAGGIATAGLAAVARASVFEPRPPGGVLPAFDPPGNLGDLGDAQKKKWSKFISDAIDRGIIGDLEGRREQFYNPTKTAGAADAATKVISWVAFPNVLRRDAPNDRTRWREADASRDRQDEYCEWSVTRNAAGKITRVTFTCEGPEYWQFLAATDQVKTLELYKTFVDPRATLADLYPDGRTYNYRNRFNNSTTGGAMHLIQGANTLRAEIDIVARATLQRRIGGRLLTGEKELIDCGGYGVGSRNSDPHIGGEVNALARQKARVTIANPVALYIEDLFTTPAWVTPDRSNPKDYWKVVRGTPDLALRAVYEVPASKPFTVGDITIADEPIGYGAQIADFIRIKVIGMACDFGKVDASPKTRCPTAEFTASDESVLDLIQTQPLHKARRN